MDGAGGNGHCRILLVDDHEIVRDGLRARLTGSSYHVVGECATLKEAGEQLGILTPDVAIVDQRLPDGEGVDIVDALSASPTTRILLHSAMLSPTLVERGLERGVHGFVGKDSGGDVLLQALAAVAHHQRYVDPTMVSALLAPREDHLTNRERDVLKGMADGLPNKEIASKLSISAETVKVHVASVLKKTGAANRTDAVAIALRKGMLN